MYLRVRALNLAFLLHNSLWAPDYGIWRWSMILHRAYIHQRDGSDRQLGRVWYDQPVLDQPGYFGPVSPRYGSHACDRRVLVGALYDPPNSLLSYPVDFSSDYLQLRYTDLPLHKEAFCGSRRNSSIHLRPEKR
jgi:hypothetical protein